ncbi:MAG TPA: hypothetical protein DCM87_02675 [Planctomycetes bacterium]|nr:hypothetical protein [Planctomycetota bacterium]
MGDGLHRVPGTRPGRGPAMIAAVAAAMLAGPPQAGAVDAWVDLGSTDVVRGVENTQRADNTDGENDAVTCGPAGRLRAARKNRGGGDDDVPDVYMYFAITDAAVKSSPRLRIAATLYDDPAFGADPVELELHYTNGAATGPADLPDTFAPHPKRWSLAGTGQCVRHAWLLTDAGFRTFMQGTSDFRIDFHGGRACVDRVDVAVEAPPPPDEHLVAAHYYPWYDTGRWDYSDCNAGALRLELLPAQQPKLGRYDSSSPAIVDRHLRWCAEYGVNVLVLEFIAPDSREDRICRDVVLVRKSFSTGVYTVPRFRLADGAPYRLRAAADGAVDIADAIFALSYLFAEGIAPACLDAADANDSGAIDIADAIALLSHLFADAGPLKPPFGECGVDPTADDMDCGGFAPCREP